MRSMSLLGGLLWLTFVSSATAQTVAYAAVVSRDEAEVRAGPNENPQLYVTNRLARGTPIQVVEELGNGWLKIRPPAGSFSWISTRFVEQIAPNQPNWMVVGHPDVRVPVIVGTEIKKEVPSQIEGSRLARGAQVTGLGPARVDDQGAWLPIEPPPGEVRYLRADAVTRSDGTRPAVPPTPAATSVAKPATVTPIPSVPLATDAEGLWMRAQQAERAGNVAEAIDLYTRAAALAQTSNPELALQARNRAHWMSAASPSHSTFTPAPLALPPSDLRLTSAPLAPPNVQLAGPVGIHTATTRPGDLGQPQVPPLAASGPGRLRRAGRALEGRTTYVLESNQGQLLYYVTPEPGVDLEPFVNQNVELSGPAAYNGELRANYMRVERVRPVQ